MLDEDDPVFRDLVTPSSSRDKAAALGDKDGDDDGDEDQEEDVDNDAGDAFAEEDEEEQGEERWIAAVYESGSSSSASSSVSVAAVNVQAHAVTLRTFGVPSNSTDTTTSATEHRRELGAYLQALRPTELVAPDCLSTLTETGLRAFLVGGCSKPLSAEGRGDQFVKRITFLPVARVLAENFPSSSPSSSSSSASTSSSASSSSSPPSSQEQVPFAWAALLPPGQQRAVGALRAYLREFSLEGQSMF
jgi:hypothetical protein